MRRTAVSIGCRTVSHSGQGVSTTETESAYSDVLSTREHSVGNTLYLIESTRDTRGR